MPHLIRSVALTVLLFCAAAHAADESWRWTGVDRVVAFADVHGAYAELVALLQKTGVIDERLAWSGGKTHLVSTGDLVDRGGRSRDVMDLLMRLQREAPAAGGRVHVLLGNHEMMNLTGDLRYVSPLEFMAFAGDEPPGAREAALAAFLAGRPDADPVAAQNEFDDRFPPGYFGLRAAFAPEGHYGKWLLERPLMIVIDKTVFTHGGLPPLVAELGLERINLELRSDLRRFVETWHRLMAEGIAPVDSDAESAVENQLATLTEPVTDAAEPPAVATPDSLEQQLLAQNYRKLLASGLFDTHGPTWYRGSALCHPLLEAHVARAALQELGAERVVVGHTPTADHRVNRRIDDSVIVLDTGMLASYYEGLPAALVIEDGGIAIVYGDNTAGEIDGDVPPERMLAEASVVSYDPATAKVRLRFRDRELSAVFLSEDRASNWRNEIAAYRLDRLLGLGLVPVTIEREIAGLRGALSLWPDDLIDELQRRERGAAIPSWCSAGNEFDLMYAFDALTYNVGRNFSNILYTGPNLSLRVVSFGRAFGTSRGMPAFLEQAELVLYPEVYRRLAALDAATLNSELDGLLRKSQIKAILKRRDEMLNTWPRLGAMDKAADPVSN